MHQILQILMKKQQKVHSQPQELGQLKTQISNNYVKQVLPYQLLIEAIALQNNQIYNLQRQYKQLFESTKNSIKNQNMQDKHRDFLQSRKKQKIMERKNFMEQGLKANKKKYQNEFQKHSQQLSEEIKLKRDQINMIKKNKVNIFVNFQEGLIGELLEQNKESSQNVKNSLLGWKNIYQREVINKKS